MTRLSGRLRRGHCRTPAERRYSRTLYRTRNIVERFFNRIKHFRRVSTRYDKLAGNYLALAVLACTFGPLVRM